MVSSLEWVTISSLSLCLFYSLLLLSSPMYKSVCVQKGCPPKNAVDDVLEITIWRIVIILDSTTCLSVCLSAVHHGFTSPLSLLILCSSSTPKQFWANSTPAKFGSRSVGFEKQFCKSRLGNSTTALLTPPHWCWWWCCCCCCWGVMWVWWVCMLWDDGGDGDGDGDGCWRIISLSLRISSTFLCECECLAAT